MYHRNPEIERENMDESAVLNGVEEKVSELVNFSFQDYVDITPVELQDGLSKVFAERIYGWKRKAKILMRLSNAHTHVQDIEQELLEACEGKSTNRTPRSKEEVARTKIREFLTSMDADKLERLCVKHSVSYSSFMGSNDKVGLVEALVDEMLVGV